MVVVVIYRLFTGYADVLCLIIRRDRLFRFLERLSNVGEESHGQKLTPQMNKDWFELLEASSKPVESVEGPRCRIHRSNEQSVGCFCDKLDTGAVERNHTRSHNGQYRQKIEAN